ncbi:molybdate transport repressor ModE-like protein [Trinickia symbiotica]|uniref:LysR family transcriptional regulator n=1 Tax=Trinickia symbiotica TaxID=863227 RepID=A0A2N7XAC8_9BURK|nr:LysR family transcriptional regulator [Trinickia symbiotica]PMS38713.1 LysR family transcriptional regulator [Trinickia symbiotica]PPK46740.1 molybdate transport repressor ModE-like protein [Trinickia symbiotica]
MMNLTHWRLLIAITETGNISKAAERVGITQSGASQAISSLEETLGVQLLVRTRGRVLLTSAGERVIRHAKTMVAEFEAIKRLGKEAGPANMNRVQLASSPTVCTILVPPLLGALKRTHPDVRVVLLEGNENDIASWLKDDKVDAGIVVNPPHDSGAVILCRSSWVAALPQSHPVALSDLTGGIDICALIREPFVVATSCCAINRENALHSSTLSPEDVRATVRDWHTALALAENGLGVTLVPAIAVPNWISNLRIVPLSSPIPCEFGIVPSAMGSRSCAVHALLDHVRATKVE